jgi:hypothetical protein
MRHHFESNLVAVEEPRVAALQDPDLAAFELFSGPRGNFMYYWYASLYVVVQGFRNLRLIDPRINALLASPNVKELRRCWNGVFHYQPDYFSATLLEPIQSPNFIGWVRELMEAFCSTSLEKSSPLNHEVFRFGRARAPFCIRCRLSKSAKRIKDLPRS